MNNSEITEDEIEKTHDRLKRDAEESGYHLNPGNEYTKDLVSGLLINEKRYGYRACPCRLASGIREEDLDIICPCDYRDPDLSAYGSCYCALYVTERVLKGETEVAPIPERRPPAEQRRKKPLENSRNGLPSLTHPVWRCSVCGYLCARDEPPEVCPICKAAKERFGRFI